MKGNPKVIEMLNQRLSEELAAILRYMVHAEPSNSPWIWAITEGAP